MMSSVLHVHLVPLLVLLIFFPFSTSICPLLYMRHVISEVAKMEYDRYLKMKYRLENDITFYFPMSLFRYKQKPYNGLIPPKSTFENH
jgi:hypothetical protein